MKIKYKKFKYSHRSDGKYSQNRQDQYFRRGITKYYCFYWLATIEFKQETRVVSNKCASCARQKHHYNY